MKSLFKIVLLVSIMLSLVGCPSDDSTDYDIRDRATVYDENIIEIEEYLETHYMTVTGSEVEIDTILPETTELSIMEQNTYPIQSVTVKNDSRTSYKTTGRIDDDVDYKLYYIVIDEGNGANPTSVDSTFVAYKGWNLENDIFDQNNTGAWFSFPDVNTSISGFRQILSKIKTSGELPSEGADGTISYSHYGNILVFIPSGLAYFSSATTNIDAYAPIAFQIKLFALKERNHDYDRVPSKYEDFSYDPVTGERIYVPDNDYFNDDTDGDEIPDFLDVDDDGDGFLTKYEVRHSITTGTPPVTTYYYYPYNGAAVDDPSTPFDDTFGIPNCSNNYTLLTRLRKHLDSSCH